MQLVYYVGSSAEGTGNEGSTGLLKVCKHAICARQEFLGLTWAWSLAETAVNTYCKLLSKCSFIGVIT